MVHVGEAREAEEMRSCSPMALSWVLKTTFSFGCMHQTFARCLVMVQEEFGLPFANVFGALEALVSYFKWFGGQPDGKQHSGLMVNVPDPSVAGTM